MQINKKYVFIGIIVTLILLVITLFLTWYITLYHTQNSHAEVVDEYADLAFEHGEIETIDESFEYHGENAYFVYLGENSDEKAYYIFVPKSKNMDEMITVEEEEGLTKDEMLSRWSEDCSNCDLKSISPGIINDQLVWEIIYTADGRYYFQNYYFQDGEIYDSISFRQQ